MKDDILFLEPMNTFFPDDMDDVYTVEDVLAMYASNPPKGLTKKELEKWQKQWEKRYWPWTSKKGEELAKPPRLRLQYGSKLGGIPALNFPILKTCTTKVRIKGKYEESRYAEHPSFLCTHCYAKSGYYKYPESLAIMDSNYKYYTEDPRGFFDELTEWCSKNKIGYKTVGYFRLFGAGDIPEFSPGDTSFLHSVNTLSYEVPDVRFWLPTLKLELVEKFIGELDVPLARNFLLRVSSPLVDTLRKLPKEVKDAGVMQTYSHYKKIRHGAYECPNACIGCFACWSTNKRRYGIVSYELHKGRYKSPDSVATALDKGYRYMPKRTSFPFRKKENIIRQIKAGDGYISVDAPTVEMGQDIACATLSFYTDWKWNRSMLDKYNVTVRREKKKAKSKKKEYDKCVKLLRKYGVIE